MLPTPNAEINKCIEMPVDYFSALGNLHDAKISLMEWNPIRKQATITVNDLYSNFYGLPEYPGQTPVCLTAFDVSALEMKIMTDRFPVRIQDFEVDELSSGPGWCILVNCTSSGSIRIVCQSLACSAIGKVETT